jgi:PadR family transcriptional regulator PadR
VAFVRDRAAYGFVFTRALSDADGLVTSEGTVYPPARSRYDDLVETFRQESSPDLPAATAASTKAAAWR